MIPERPASPAPEDPPLSDDDYFYVDPSFWPVRLLRTWDDRAVYWRSMKAREADAFEHAARSRHIHPAGVLDALERRRLHEMRQLDPVSDFRLFFEWWARGVAVPPNDPQDPLAVRGWLLDLDREVVEAWAWYRKGCEANYLEPQTDVFGAASDVAEVVVGRLLDMRVQHDIARAPKTLLAVREHLTAVLIPRVDVVAARLGMLTASRSSEAPARSIEPSPGRPLDPSLDATLSAGLRNEAAILAWLLGTTDKAEQLRRFAATGRQVEAGTKAMGCRVPKTSADRILKSPKHPGLKAALSRLAALRVAEPPRIKPDSRAPDQERGQVAEILRRDEPQT